MPYLVYILQSQKLKQWYIGSTGDFLDRFTRHNKGESKATKAGVPWSVIFTKEFPTKTEALRYEQYLKSLKNKKYITEIIIKNL